MRRTRISRLNALLLSAGLGLVACSDGPTGPGSRAAAVAATGLQAQSATAGTAVQHTPAVIVRDGRGEPSQGVSVWFRVTAGGGSVAASMARTNADGIASAGSWTLGAAPGANTVLAEVSGHPPIEFTATGVAAAPPPEPTGGASAYDIVVRYVGAATARQRQAVDYAVGRWRSVITGDLPSVQATVPMGSCFDTQPALNEVVDDILIFVEFEEIDGAGKILGEAGPCYIRNGSGLPVVGSLRLDAADLAQMEANGTLDAVVTHEIGHVLGFGTLWTRAGLLNGAGTADPQFSGAAAIAQYRMLGGTAAGVPVENTGSEGTRDGHWRESVFGSELMTGYVSRGTNPLSAMSAASMRDMGYTATTAGSSTFSLGMAVQSEAALEGGIDVRNRERMLRPRFEIDRDGRRARLPDPSR